MQMARIEEAEDEIEFPRAEIRVLERESEDLSNSSLEFASCSSSSLFQEAQLLFSLFLKAITQIGLKASSLFSLGSSQPPSYASQRRSQPADRILGQPARQQSKSPDSQHFRVSLWRIVEERVFLRGNSTWRRFPSRVRDITAVKLIFGTQFRRGKARGLLCYCFLLDRLNICIFFLITTTELLLQ